MNEYPLNHPWEETQLSFVFPYGLVLFLSPFGYIDGYFLDYGAFRPVNEQAFNVIRPFMPYRRTGGHFHD